MREDDALNARPDGTNLFEERETFLDGVVGAGDDDTKGSDAKTLKGIGVTGRVLHGQGGGGKGVADLAAELVASDDEDPAHGVLRDDDQLILDHLACRAPIDTLLRAGLREQTFFCGGSGYCVVAAVFEVGD